jgi:ribonuclease G
LNRLIIQHTTREKRFALLKNGKPERLYIEQPSQQSLVGNVYLGTVEKVVPGMNAAFVQFGEEKSGFLFRDKLPSFVLDSRAKEEKANRSITHYLHQGEKLLVQVEKDAAGTKGAKLTALIELPGDDLIYLPSGKYTAVSKKIADPDSRQKLRELGTEIKREEEGLIIRTSAASRSEDSLRAQLERLRTQYGELEAKAKGMKKPGLVLARDFFYEELAAELEKMKSGEVILDDQALKKRLEELAEGKDLSLLYHQHSESIFSAYGIEKEIERALKRVVWLENGAYLIFDEAEALTIVDVNTGKFSGKTDLRETVLKTNKLAAAEIARQLKLRDLGGMILVDFIDMKQEEDREAVLGAFEKSLYGDGRRTRITGFTSLGILQLTRKKTKLSLGEALTESCGVCSGTGRVLSTETIAFRLERELWEYRLSDYEAVLVAATTDVARVFAGPGQVHLERMEEAIGLNIYFTELAEPKPDYSIRQLGTKADLSAKADLRLS